MNNMTKANILDFEEPLSKALSILMDTGTAVFIVKNREYIGLIDDRILSPNISDSSSVKCGNRAVRTPVIKPNSELKDTINSFLSGKYKALPVVDNKDNILGMVTKVELMKDIMNSGVLPQSYVSDLMKSPVYSIDYSTSVGKARQEMKNKNVHKLLVMYNGKPRGIISTFDFSTIIMKPRKRERAPIISEIKNPDEKPISEMLRERIFSVEKNIPLQSAISLMISKNVSDLLVTENGTPKGVLSSTDVFKELSKISKPQFNIQISGLNREEDKQHLNLIFKKIESQLKKYSKNFIVNGFYIHIKRKKSVFEARAKLDLEKNPISISYESHEIPYLVEGLLKELKNLLSRKKSKNSTRYFNRKNARRI
ncbi:MAG: CBS domain-containing protein [Candidatus ainarchaeum sp.]|nr:CBS domain-containing protein [Candidatus ainarchaeum sp.]